MRSYIFASIASAALLFLQPVMAEDSWNDGNWGDQDISASISCTKSPVAVSTAQGSNSQSTVTNTNTKFVTYALAHQQPASSHNDWQPPTYPTWGNGQDQTISTQQRDASLLPSFTIPGYPSSGWIIKTMWHHETATIIHSIPSGPSPSYPSQPSWGNQFGPGDHWPALAATTVTVTTTTTETDTNRPAEYSTLPVSYGIELSPYSVTASSSSSTCLPPYVIPSVAPVSTPSWPINPEVFDFQEQPSHLPKSTLAPPPATYQPTSAPASASESAPATFWNPYLPPPTEAASYADTYNSNGYVGYAWTA